MKKILQYRHALFGLIMKGFFTSTPAFMTACVPPRHLNDQTAISYFCEIATETEYSSTRGIHKWADDIVIYKSGKWPQHMSDELNQIVRELNALIAHPKVSVTTNPKKANFSIFLGSADQYQAIEPHATRIKDNWGLFYIHKNHRKEILKGSMYVDMTKTRRKKHQKHLLREELTQALGLLNDSILYRNSMFYQNFSETTAYSELDKLMIKLLYQPEIKPSMGPVTAREAIQKYALLDRLR